MRSKLFLVRHGQSVWNLENRFTGWQDVDLSPKGEQEAIQAGLLLKDQRIEIGFTSTLIRATHTFEIIQNQMDHPFLKVFRNKALNERSYGDLEGLNKDEITKKFGAEQVQLWRRSFEVRPPGGESLKDTFDRVIPYFETEIQPFLLDQKNVLIVAHGNSLRALILFLEKLTPIEIAKTEIPTGEPLVYHFGREGIQKEDFFIQ